MAEAVVDGIRVEADLVVAVVLKDGQLVSGPIADVKIVIDRLVRAWESKKRIEVSVAAIKSLSVVDDASSMRVQRCCK